ncbi:transporter [Ganoderma sinense ZZ0214-1]|uniref:Transporter n=1 Tax=Ganoderma sinense ZZ0214-1 TaxID=1077348 RepID=A0A2G8SDU6_9APHY|nr:transporter [Ganoderma sinense ZZ0214-1]
MPSRHHSAIHLGGKRAIGIFAVCLVAFVVETQLAQYVQAQLDFQRPYLIFYVVHSSFAISFPLHVIYLSATSQHSIASILKTVLIAVQKHLSPKATSTLNATTFPTRRFLWLIFYLTTGLTVPSILWFVAIALAPVTDVTALWNTNALFAYVFTVYLFGHKWDARRLLAVLIATAGAAVVVYGDSGSNKKSSEFLDSSAIEQGPRPPLIGDLLTLVASLLYAAYQVAYKAYAALPNDPEVAADDMYTPLAATPDEPTDDLDAGPDAAIWSHAHIIDPLPFGLHPNLLTLGIGTCTLLVFWVPIPILHIIGIEPFELPHRGITYAAIGGIALSGAIFNAGFMVLLGVWGPVVTSVGSLLTIVLVFLSDAIWGGAVDMVTIWSVLGCTSIIVAFAILAYDMMKGR